MELTTNTEWIGDGKAIVEQTRAGMSRAEADEIARPLGLTDKEMARILNLSERTLHRLRPDTRLDSNASERLLLLDVLIRHGLDVFDGRIEVLGRWLHGPCLSFVSRLSWCFWIQLSAFPWSIPCWVGLSTASIPSFFHGFDRIAGIRVPADQKTFFEYPSFS